jgi:hypothetical protein
MANNRGADENYHKGWSGSQLSLRNGETVDGNDLRGNDYNIPESIRLSSSWTGLKASGAEPQGGRCFREMGDAITDSHLDKESKGNGARTLISGPNAIAKTQLRSITPNNKCCTGVLLQEFACTGRYATEKMPLLILKGLQVCR